MMPTMISTPQITPQQNGVSDLQQAQLWLENNQVACSAYQQPDLPVMVLKIGEQQHVFNSVYRVWRIESLLADSLEVV